MQNNKAFRLNCSPGGAYEILMVLCSIYGFEADTIILDEPGKTLHPSFRKKLGNYIKQDNEHSYLVVTHSPDLISNELLYSILRCLKTKTGSQIKYLRSFLEGLKDEERYNRFLLDPNIKSIFFASNVIFVEGTYDNKIVTTLFSVLENHHIQKELNLSSTNFLNWDVISIDGTGDISKALSIADFFDIKYVLICDFDAFLKPKNSLTNSYISKILKQRCNINLDEIFSSKTTNIQERKKEIISFAKNYNIFSWENDLEGMIKKTVTKFKKDDWKDMTFEECFNLVIKLIKNKNTEFLAFLEFLGNLN